MTGLGEIKANGYMPQRAYIALMARGGWSLSKVILFNMRELKRLRVVPEGEERHVRPTEAIRDTAIPRIDADLPLPGAIPPPHFVLRPQ